MAKRYLTLLCLNAGNILDKSVLKWRKSKSIIKIKLNDYRCKSII